MVKAGRFTWIDKGRALTDTAHVDNVVQAIRLALTQGKGGEAQRELGYEPVVSREAGFAARLSRAAQNPG